MCVRACSPGRIACGGLCVDTRDDPDHCGRCDNACGGQVACENGSCGGVCAGRLCGELCVDTEVHPQHCGECGRDCGLGGVCLGGDCRCGESTTDCGRYCADTAQDPENCGGCGRDCDESEECIDSDCRCREGYRSCDGDCTDTSRDPANCGACDRRCADDEGCQDSTCVCRPGLVPHEGACVDPMADGDACGPALVDCQLPTPSCQAGVCVAACAEPLHACGSSCVDRDTDPLHCGECGDSCDADQLCVDGDCRRFTPAAGCTTCPCHACDDEDPCCAYPGDDLLVCLNGDECP
jgi:hypothetical protein